MCCRFTDMVKWMDAVDRSLENVLKDLLTIEEFESERAVFQVRTSKFIVILHASCLH